MTLPKKQEKKENQNVLLLSKGHFKRGTVNRTWTGTGVISAVTSDGEEHIYEPGEYINLPMLIETLDWGIFV